MVQEEAQGEQLDGSRGPLSTSPAAAIVAGQQPAHEPQAQQDNRPQTAPEGGLRQGEVKEGWVCHPEGLAGVTEKRGAYSSRQCQEAFGGVDGVRRRSLGCSNDARPASALPSASPVLFLLWGKEKGGSEENRGGQGRRLSWSPVSVLSLSPRRPRQIRPLPDPSAAPTVKLPSPSASGREAKDGVSGLQNGHRIASRSSHSEQSSAPEDDCLAGAFPSIISTGSNRAGEPVTSLPRKHLLQPNVPYSPAQSKHKEDVGQGAERDPGGGTTKEREAEAGDGDAMPRVHLISQHIGTRPDERSETVGDEKGKDEGIGENGKTDISPDRLRLRERPPGNRAGVAADRPGEPDGRTRRRGSAGSGYVESPIKGSSLEAVERGKQTRAVMSITGVVQQIYAGHQEDWRRDRKQLLSAIQRMHLAAAFAGLVGIGFSVAENELMLRGEEADSVFITILKLCCSVSSLACLACVYCTYYLDELFQRLQEHIRIFIPFNPSVSGSAVLCHTWFWVEASIAILHVPPLVTGEYSTMSQDNFVLYKAETICCCISTLRVYLIWPCICDFVLMRLPKRFPVESVLRIHFGHGYVLKTLLDGWHAIITVALVWTALLFILGYWFRSVETTACLFPNIKHPMCQEVEAHLWTLDGHTFFEKVNDLYIQNSVWSMFVASTTVGYGDIVPTTHAGRAVSLAMALCGITLSAIMTATLSGALQWNQQELWVYLLCKRAKAKQMLPETAARLIGRWWRAKRKGMQPRDLHEITTMKASLKSLIESQREDLESAKSNDHKMDHVLHRAQYIASAIEDISNRIQNRECLRQLLERPDSQDTEEVFERQAATMETLGHQTLVKGEQAVKAGLKERFAQNLEMLRLSSVGAAPLPRSQQRLTDRTGPKKRAVQSRARLMSILQDSKSNKEMHERQEQEFELSHERDQGFGLSQTAEKSLQSRKASQYRTLRVPDVTRAKIESALAPRTKRNWRRDHNALDKVLVRNRTVVTALSFGGVLCAVGQNELIFVGYDPNSVWVNSLKFANSILTCFAIAGIYRTRRLHLLLKRTLLHLHHFCPINRQIQARDVLRNSKFWLEVIVVGIHLPIFCTGEFGMTLMGNFILYRWETIFCCLNFLRLYLAWHSWCDWMVSDLPLRNTFAGYSNIQVGSSFACKRALNSWYAGLYIASIWCVLVLCLGYLFRSVELSACLFPWPAEHEMCRSDAARYWKIYSREFEKVNDYYLYNAIWYMFVSTTTVGYGDINSSTHIGRVFSVIAVLSGLVLTALFTASLSNKFRWSATETKARAIFSREKARRDQLVLAANIICFWWRRRSRGKELTQKQKMLNPKELARQWRALKRRAQASFHDMSDMGSKIESSRLEMEHIEAETNEVAQCLWQGDLEDLIDHHKKWELAADNVEMADFWKKRMMARQGKTEKGTGHEV